MTRPIPPAYKTRNWPAYNEALKRRGSLTIWFNPAMTWEAAPTGRRGRQPDYSDAAIQTCLTMKVLFGMALRQTTGFVESLLRLIGLDWAVPDFSTLSRRQKTLKVNIPYRGSDGPLHPEAELYELTRIYVARGLDEGLARQVAIQLTEKDALGVHSRDELGISETVTAHPIQAALVSAATFAVGAVIPLIIAALVPAAQITLVVAVTTLVALSVLGGLGASVGGAGIVKGAIRVTFWGALAMAATAAVGMIFGVTVG